MPATTKLYPPVIAGTLPSMVYAKGPLLRVPFSMNRAVAASQVTGLRMRLRTTNTDTILCEMDIDASADLPNVYPITSASTAEDSLVAIFSLMRWHQRFSIGQSYKVQIAYIDTDNICGYFSTVAIVKCTDTITVNIAGLDAYSNNYDLYVFTGEYLNNDVTEVVYQYKFDLYSSSQELVETTGWQPHEHYGDPEANRSEDSWSLGKVLVKDEYYLLRYTVQTNSFYEVSSPWYTIVAGTGLPSDIKAPLRAVLDYDNALIKIKYNAVFEMNSGRYEFSRASSKDNFSSWTKLFNFSLTQDMITGEYFYTDFIIEHGVTYRYSVRQYNSTGLFSKRTVTNDVTAYFEDLFLWDGQRQLNIKFNPKVNSFKRVINESKKNTIGYKYPKYFRNGIVDYKEFQLSGLLSYLMDEHEYFYSKAELGYPDHENETDLTDENIALERRFNMAALEWLSDGKPKLLKSPGEGNYLIELMNTSLTPNDSVTRMLHTFQSQGSECGNADSLADLKKFGLYKEPYSPTAFAAAKNKAFTYYTLQLLDILNNDNPSVPTYEGVGSIKIEHCVPGTVFSLFITDESGTNTEKKYITIGATGYYYLECTDGSLIREISIVKQQQASSIYDSIYNGVITVGAIIRSDFNTVNYCNPVEELCIQRWGLGMANNLFDYMLPISRLYRLKFSRFTGQVVDIQNTSAVQADNTLLQHERANYVRTSFTAPYFLNPNNETHYNGLVFGQTTVRETNQPIYYYSASDGDFINYMAYIVFEDNSRISLNLNSLKGTQVFTEFKSIPVGVYAGNGVLVEISCQTQEAVYNTGSDSTLYYYTRYIQAKRNLQTLIHTPQSWENTNASLSSLQQNWLQEYNSLIKIYNESLYNYSQALKSIWDKITTGLSEVDIWNIDAYTNGTMANETALLNNNLYIESSTYADSGRKPVKRQLLGV